MGKGDFIHPVLVTGKLCFDLSFTKKISVWKSGDAHFVIMRKQHKGHDYKNVLSGLQTSGRWG